MALRAGRRKKVLVAYSAISHPGSLPGALHFEAQMRDWHECFALHVLSEVGMHIAKMALRTEFGEYVDSV